ncbi:MAG: hypothetical protein M1607_05030 [Patescibacteria group bacterium]|nr:hypothetical protein [Patescibacteria group bacterium]
MRIKLILNIFILLVSFIILVGSIMFSKGTVFALGTEPTPVPCDHSFHHDSYSCDNNQIIDNQSNGCGEHTSSVKEDCSTKNGDVDFICVSGQAECYKYYHAVLEIQPNNPELGDNNVQVSLHSTYSCYNGDNNFILDLGSGMRSINNFDQSCNLVFQNCRQTAYGDLRCLWTGTCVAKGLQSNYNATFSSEKSTFNPYGVEYYPLQVGDCNASFNYSIVNAQTCQADPADAMNVTDPVATQDAFLFNSQKIVAPSLRGDRLMAKAMIQGLEPPSINDEINSNIAPKDQYGNVILPIVGVQVGFFNTITRILCDIPILRSLLYCPGPINLAVDHNLFASTDQTDLFASQAAALAGTSRPPELTPVPVKPSCYLEDIALQNGDPSQGNLKMNNIDTDMGQTVYGETFPQFSNYTTYAPSIGALGIDASKNNISLGGKVFYGDQRSLQVNLNQKLYYQTSYPNDVIPFNDASY